MGRSYRQEGRVWMKSKENEMTFESAMSRLEEIVALLEDSSAPLDKAMELYTEGSKLAAFCSAKLEKAEQIVKKAATEKTWQKEEE